MNKYFFLIVFLFTLFLFSCEENNDSPEKQDIKGEFNPDDISEVELLESVLGYISSLDFKISSVAEHNVVNLKNGDRFYYIKVVNDKAVSTSMAFQFAGTYDNKVKNNNNVVVISCNNDGACPECLLTLQGNCGVMSCSCFDKSKTGLYDCTMLYKEINTFTTDYNKKGKELLKNITVPKLNQLYCEQY